jgi:hypothetical protein
MKGSGLGKDVNTCHTMFTGLDYNLLFTMLNLSILIF